MAPCRFHLISLSHVLLHKRLYISVSKPDSNYHTFVYETKCLGIVFGRVSITRTCVRGSGFSLMFVPFGSSRSTRLQFYFFRQRKMLFPHLKNVLNFSHKPKTKKVAKAASFTIFNCCSCTRNVNFHIINQVKRRRKQIIRESCRQTKKSTESKFQFSVRSSQEIVSLHHYVIELIHVNAIITFVAFTRISVAFSVFIAVVGHYHNETKKH